MAQTLDGALEVATCIGCGARSRPGECPGGCDDVPLDLVDAGDLEALTAAVGALRRRLAALRPVAEALAEGSGDLERLRTQASDALRVAVPADTGADATIVEAWGCPECRRIDAPQPCIGVCVRRPVLMVDAAPHRELASELRAGEAADRALTAVARLAATVSPRPGQEDRTQAALRSRARAALAELT